MKLRLNYFALAFGALLLSGCGGSGLAGGGDDVDPLTPEVEEEFVPTGPKPPEGAAVITTDDSNIYDVSGESVLLRGVNLQYGDSPATRLAGIAAIRDVSSNVVRLMLKQTTTSVQLAAALDEIVANDMVAILTLDDPDNIACNDNDDYMIDSATDLWLKDWVAVLAEGKYQSHLMINIANEWGPMNIFNANSIGYDAYIASYKIMIRRFRESGFKVPLVIDAPHCGRDYNAFLGGRGRELKAADPEQNLVLSAHAFGSRWNSRREITYAAEQLAKEKLPLVITEFGGSEVSGVGSIDHMELLQIAAGETALSIDLPWATPSDKAGYGYVFASPMDFSLGAGIQFDVYIPGQYQQDGKLTLQAFLFDNQGRYAGTTALTADTFEGDAWNQVVVSIDDANDLVNAVAGFDLANISRVGVELYANGKPVDVTGGIKLDNILVGIEAGGNSSAAYQATFDSTTEGWAIGFGAGDSSSVNQDSGHLTLLAPWDAENASSQIGYGGLPSNDPAIDISQPMTLSVEVFIPNEYADETGFNLQFFFNGESYTGFAGFGYRTLAAFNLGEWNTVTFEILDFEESAGYVSSDFPLDAPVQQVGIQVGGITSAKTEALRFDNFQIIPEEPAEVVTVYESNFEFDDGWGRSFGAGDDSSVNVADGVLQVLAPWGEEGSANNIAFAYRSAASLRPGVDFSQPMTVTMDVFIPESYDDESDFNLQYWFGANDYSGFAGIGYRNRDGLVLGAWQTITVTFSDIVAEAGFITDGFVLDRPPRQFGVMLSGINNAHDEPILIDNFVVERLGASLVPANIVLDIPFATQEQIDAFPLTYWDGEQWTESTLSGATMLDYSLNPFGWVAWSWIGSTEGEGETVGVLDLSTSEDTAELTTRGDEIVFGDKGIVETAQDANFQ